MTTGNVVYFLEYATLGVGIIITLYNWVMNFVVGCLAAVFLSGATFVCLAILYRLECKLTVTTAVGWKLRPHASAGCWCAIILPLILVSSDFPKTVTILSWTLSVASVVFLQGVAFSSLAGKQLQVTTIGWQIVAVSFAGGLFASYIEQKDLYSCLLINGAAQLIFVNLLMTSLQRWPGSFTLGEAILWSQAVSVFTVISSLELFFTSYPIASISERKGITAFVQVMLLGCELAVGLWLSFPVFRNPCGFYFVGFGVLIAFILPGTSWCLQQNVILWIIKFMTANPQRVGLISMCFLLTLGAALVVILQQYAGKQASTIVRKIFHVLILLIYVPCLCLDPELLRLASFLVFGIFIILESMRALNVPPVGTLLNQTLTSFLDEKDSGPLVLTPMYLLLGCSIPLWVSPIDQNDGVSLARLSGLLFLGIGDAAASVGGTLFGRHKWPETKKTVEGTSIAVLAQLVALVLLVQTGWMFRSSIPLLSVLLVIVVSSLMEAFTSQVDNIVIPLVSYFMCLSIKI